MSNLFAARAQMGTSLAFYILFSALGYRWSSYYSLFEDISPRLPLRCDAVLPSAFVVGKEDAE